MTNNQLTQVAKAPVVLSSPTLVKDGVSLTAPATEQGDLTLLGTMQVLSSATDKMAPDETEASTEEYAPEETPDETIVYKGLIGGSALSMSSLSLIELEKNLLKLSLNSMKQSILANEAMNSSALQQYNSSLDAADDSFEASKAQASAELTSCITSAISAGGSLAIAGVGLSKMNKASDERSRLGAQKAYFRNTKDEPVNPNARPNNPHTVIGSEDAAEALSHRQTTIKTALEDNKGKKLTGTQKARLGIESDDDHDFKMAQYKYNEQKIKAIQEAMEPNAGPGRLDASNGSFKWKNADGKEVDYGELNVHKDEIAQYGLRKKAYDMHEADTNDAVLKGSQDKLDHYLEPTHKEYDDGKNLIQQALPAFQEIVKSINSGITSGFTMEKARHEKDAAISNADASLFRSSSDQLSALQSTWNSLNSKYYDQTMSLLPNQMSALVKANSAG